LTLGPPSDDDGLHAHADQERSIVPSPVIAPARATVDRGGSALQRLVRRGADVRVAARLIVLLVIATSGCVADDAARSGARDGARDTTRIDTAAAAPMPAATPDARWHVAIDGEGIRLVNEATGATRPVAFGAAAESAIVAATAASGAIRSRGTNQDCGAGPLEIISFEDGLSLHVQAGRFVGWSANGARAPHTMSGIGIGSTRAELEAAYTADIRRTTLGTEFAAGGLQGVLASPAADARVTALWAGTSCVAR
jgi:hypothetical protein